MLRTVLLLFCMSAAIYGALSCSSSKKSEPDAAPETQEDAKEESDLGSPAQSAAAPVVKKDPPKDESTSENPDHNSNSFQAPSEANAALHITEERSTPRSQVQSFNGIGCYLTTNKVNNEVKLELKQNIKMSHRVCALECARKSPLKRYKYFGLANGENCLCASELPRNAIKVDNPEVHCSYRCPGNHLQSCGGENAAAYFSVSTTLSSMRKDKFEQGAKVYPVIPASDSLKCYENRRKLTKVLQSNEMSHLVCASECVRRDLYGKKFKYFAITDSDTCFCASTLPTSTEKTKNTYCSYRCPGNHNQSCGADHKIAYFNLSSTTVPPKKDKYEQGMMILPAFTLGNFPLAGCLSLHPGYMIKTVLNKKVMTYRDCAQECVRKDFYETYKYFAIQNIRKCLCAKKIPTSGHGVSKVDDKLCKSHCPIGSNEYCGSQGLTAFFKLTLRKPDLSRFATSDMESAGESKSGLQTPDPRSHSVTANPRDPIGCYSIYQGYPMAKLELIEKEKMSHRVCAFECRKKNALKKFKYFSLAFGDSCLCASELPHDSYRLSIEKDCSIRCPASHMESCGGESGAAYFSLSTITNSPNIDKFEQGVKVYPVIPASDSLKCYENRRKLTKVLQSDDEMSHLVCASECVRRDLYGKKFKYFAITDSDTCFCASTLPTSTEKTKNTYCSYRCPGNHNQSCGADHKIAYFNLSSTTVPPEKDKYEQGMMILPAFTLGNFPLAGCLSLHPGYMIKTVLNKKVMTYRDCAQECVRKDFYETYKYFAIQNIRKCLCAKKIPTSGHGVSKVDDKLCKSHCPIGSNEYCGSQGLTAFFKLTLRKPDN
ncbi:hypothetical protein BOX15_Mlig000913g1 [Macrostomum lignano]|uniref:WSC domain-containing protein n=3 Tax=Macrostomum lignano TaxID=282301 RepID=A0A267DPX3_9PLAT|nr:hypothetical protein BOX15_Mlig000913g1 [Macrostomum lignano]